MKRLVEILVLVLLAMPAAEARRMTMAEVIEAARMQSVAALEARHAFISDTGRGAHTRLAGCRHCISTETS